MFFVGLLEQVIILLLTVGILTGKNTALMYSLDPLTGVARYAL